MILAVALLLVFQTTPDLRQHVEAGLAAKRAGNLDLAIREFKRVVELAPGLPAAYVNLGAAYCEEKDYGNAIVPLRRAIELDQNQLGAHGMLGLALLTQGYVSESIPHLEKAQEDGLLGVALLESGRPRDAIGKLEAALQKQPGDMDLLYYIGKAFGDLSKQTFEFLIQENPNSARARQVLGDARLASGNRDAAEKDFRVALALRPDLRGVHYALGEIYLTSGDYAGAEREFREETRQAPGSAAAAYKLGVVLLNRGELTAAIAELQRANGLQPGMPETLLELGKATAAAGNAATAEKLFRQVLEQESASALAEAAHFQLAQIYRKLGRASEANQEMKQFQDLRNNRKVGQ